MYVKKCCKIGRKTLRAVEQNRLQVATREVFIFPLGERGFDDRHPVEEAQEVGSLDSDGIYLLVAQFNEESSVSAVLLPGDCAEVWERVVPLVSVDVVQFPAFRHGPPRSHPDGLMDIDVFTMSESMVEIHVLLVFASAMLAWVYYGFLACLVAYADAVVVSQGAIEGESRLRARTHVIDKHVVAKERHGFFVRKPDDLKCGHSSQGFGHRRHRRR